MILVVNARLSLNMSLVARLFIPDPNPDSAEIHSASICAQTPADTYEIAAGLKMPEAEALKLRIDRAWAQGNRILDLPAVMDRMRRPKKVKAAPPVPTAPPQEKVSED